MAQFAYACLRDAREQANVQSSTSTSEDDYLLSVLRFTSRRCEAITGLEFAPRIDTLYLDALDIDPDVLRLPAPLLSITTVTDGQSNSLTQGTDFNVWPRSSTPYRTLRMLDSAAYAWNLYSTEWMDAISITGIWGWRRQYATAWLSTGDTVQDAPLADDAVTLAVSDADGADAYGRTPRFSPGQLLKIESEYLEVLAVDTSTDTLTVTRGAQGSTAAEHAASTVIYVWEAEPAIQRATLVWAAYLLARRGQYEQVKFDGIGAVSFPADAPAEVMNIFREGGWLRSIRSPL